MKSRRTKLAPATRRLMTEVYGRLDYGALGPVYCYEGGDEFWRAKRRLCNRLGSRVAVVLRRKLRRGGRSLYVGAGVAELPPLIMETMELGRTVEPYNLRRAEVAALNRACHSIPLTFHAADAAGAKGRFDHLWMASVLNDPERFPHLSPLSYGRGNPLTLDPLKFGQERRIVRALVARCMGKLAGLDSSRPPQKKSYGLQSGATGIECPIGLGNATIRRHWWEIQSVSFKSARY